MRAQREAKLCDSDCTRRRLLRPVRRGDQCRSLPGVPGDPRRSAAVLQRATRLLCAQPVRRCRPGARRPRNLQLGPRRDHRADQGQHRHPARRDHLRGPADPRRAPQTAGPHVHPAQDQRPRTQDPRILRAQFGSDRRRRQFRLRRRPRRADADAGDRHAARHPRGVSGSRARHDERPNAHRGRQADGAPPGSTPASSSPTSSTGAPSIPPTTS